MTAPATGERGRSRPVRRRAFGALLSAALACPANHGAALAPAPRDAAETGILCFPTDTGAEITTSIYSLPAHFFSLAEAERFLGAVRRIAPRREIVALSDLELASNRNLHVIATSATDAFSPWPRDPFSLAHDDGGRVRVVVRPNLQRGREADGRLGETLVAGLPDAVRRMWNEPRWSTAPVPFHNGQLLVDREALWLSIHSVEPRTLELLGLARVPVASFAATGGAARYADAARRAADELGELYGRPARFVHALPDGGTADAELMATLGGGAGFDLDSLLTLLRPATGPPAALVADLSIAAALLPAAADPSWEELRRSYGFVLSAGDLRGRLATLVPGSRADRLDRFLDHVAEHLTGEGFTVERLPALLVPVPWLGRPELTHPDFVLGWNNVVVERTDDGLLRAEGFASGLPALDREAERRFTAAGVSLSLLPPLIESIVRNGGYRCASNHLRVADCPAAPTAAGDGSSRNR